MPQKNNETLKKLPKPMHKKKTTKTTQNHHEKQKIKRQSENKCLLCAKNKASGPPPAPRYHRGSTLQPLPHPPPHTHKHTTPDGWTIGRTSRGSSFFGDFFAALLGVMAGRERLPGAGASLDGIGMGQLARPCSTFAAR